MKQVSDKTWQKIAENKAEEALHQAWEALQSVPSYVETQAVQFAHEDEYFCGLCGFVPIASPCPHLKG